MIYEGTISYETTTKNGNTHTVKETYLIENALTFADAENTLIMYALAHNLAIDVVSLKRSKIKEIARHGGKLDTAIFIATLIDVFTDDEGKERELKYDIAFFAPNIQEAHNFIIMYTEQGYCMEMRSLKQTKYIDILDETKIIDNTLNG